MPDNKRKENIENYFNKMAEFRNFWKDKNLFFHEEDEKYLSFLIPKGSNIIVLGCGTGHLIPGLEPEKAIGIDMSQNMINIASKNNNQYEFIVGDIEDKTIIESIDQKFDYILLPDTIGFLDDCQSTISLLHRLCDKNTRVVISYYSYLWEPILKIAEILKLKMPQIEMNYLTTDDIVNLLNLAEFEVIKQEWRQILPIRLFGIGPIINKYIATLPFIRKLCLRNYVIARSLDKIDKSLDSCSIIIPCKNEKGNIEEAVKRIPDFCENIEIVFVEGHSTDGTFEEIESIQSKYNDKNIIAIKQSGVGKADAVYKAFDIAKNQVLMILDADLTVPPEQLDKFWHTISSGKGEYINGSRLVYPMEKDAMRFLNFIANRLFSIIFSWLLNQRYTDTLCGTKVITKSNYIKIKNNRNYFGDFDPFGDFDLIFGSSKLNLKMVEIPIQYQARSYGETQISRFKHGILLLKMAFHGYKKLKAF